MKRWLATAVFFTLPVAVWGHEVQDNRATLVLRNGNQVSVTLYLDWVGVLYRTLAPGRRFAEFVGVCSTMRPEDLQKQIQRAEAKLQSGTSLSFDTGESMELAGWVWPGVAETQTQIQKLLMQGILDPQGHVHEEPTEVRAQAIASRQVKGVKVRFPKEFQGVLVVAYEPSQMFVGPGETSGAVQFRPRP